jgi:restriction system protein
MGVLMLHTAEKQQAERALAEEARQAERADEALTVRIRAHFREHPSHLAILQRIHDRTVYKDEFGDSQFDDWFRQLDEYIEKKMSPLVAGSEIGVAREKILDELDKFIDEHYSDADLDPTSDSGPDYESHCLARLQLRGFDVVHTGGPGDQGADLLAQKGRYRLAIQCKRRSVPVGNSAVQEAAAARQFYDCTHAIVVSDAGFTRAARQLAQKLDVSLLSTDELICRRGKGLARVRERAFR